MQLPFLRQINRESHPNPVINQLNPQRRNGITAGIAGIPKVGIGSINHKATGGPVRFDDGGSYAQSNYVDPESISPVGSGAYLQSGQSDPSYPLAPGMMSSYAYSLDQDQPQQPSYAVASYPNSSRHSNPTVPVVSNVDNGYGGLNTDLSYPGSSSGWQDPSSIDPSSFASQSSVSPNIDTSAMPTDSGQYTPGGYQLPSAPSYTSTSATRSNWQDPSTIDPNQVVKDTNGTGFGGWLQSKHGGITGAQWMKAGLTALTGILSGVANKRAANSVPKVIGNQPQTAPTINQGQIGVPGIQSYLASGGQYKGYDIHMVSPNEPSVWMAEGGQYRGYDVHMKSPNEPSVWMADGGVPPAGMMPMPSQQPTIQPGASNSQQMASGAPGQANPQAQAIATKAVQALLGQSQNPKADLAAFVQMFGQDALKQLVEKIQQMKGAATAGGGIAEPPAPAQGQGMQTPAPGMAKGGYLQGSGDGMSDSIPANGGNVALANNEYVVPADAVSQVGNGSSDAGAKKLDAAIGALRTKKYGRNKQPPKLSDTSNPVLKALKG